MSQAAANLVREAPPDRRAIEAALTQASDLHNQGRHDLALSTLLDTESAVAALGDPGLALDFHRKLGNVYDLLGDFEKALAHYLEASGIATREDEPRAAAMIEHGIGILVSKRGDAKRGLEHYLRAVNLYQVPEDAIPWARTQNNIGINLKNLGRLEESLVHLRLAIEVFVAHGLAANEGGARNNLALTLARMGEDAAAEEAFAQALALTERGDWAMGRCNVMLDAGRHYLDRGRAGEARPLLEAALRIAVDAQALQHEVECREALARLFEAEGRSEAALEALKRTRELERRLFSERSEERLRQLQIAYQVEQVRREAEIHRLRNVELARANMQLQSLNEQLREANRQKTELLAELARQTREDPLTGLANRRHLDEALERAYRRAQRGGRPLAVAICDIDNFKRINDTWTHAAGDDVLVRVAQLMRAELRQSDVLARYGGEEFVLLLEEADLEAAHAACEKVRAAVAGHDWAQVRPGLVVTLSFGVAERAGRDHPQAMLLEADRALYRAKAAGKNRVERA